MEVKMQQAQTLQGGAGPSQPPNAENRDSNGEGTRLRLLKQTLNSAKS